MVRKVSWMLTVILVVSLLLSLFPTKESVRAENSTSQSEIVVTDANILDQEGEKNTPDNRVKNNALVTIDLAWQIDRPDLIEEGETRVLTLPNNLVYIEQGGSLSDEMGSFQVSNGSIHFTFSQNYQMELDEMVPDYRSVRQYQGNLTIQAEVPAGEVDEVLLNFGSQIEKSLFIETESDQKTEPSSETNSGIELRDGGRNLNELGIWVIRSMKVTDEDGNDFTEQEPPTRDDNIQIDFKWALENDKEIQAGDYYTYQLPDYFAVHQTIKDEPLKNSVPGRDSLGTFDLSITGLLTIKFNEKASNVSNREGAVQLSTQLDVEQYIDKIIVEEQINEDGSTSGEVEVEIAQAEITKTGVVGKDNIITWEIIINGNSRKLSKVKVTDTLQANHEFLSTSCEVPDGNNGWKPAAANFYLCRHFRPENERSYFELSFPELDRENKKLTHPVKFFVRSRITDSGEANAYQNTAAISGSNFRENGVLATVSLVDIPSYKFLIDSQFDKGILDWRIKATINNNDGTMIDQMYKNDVWPQGALHYLDQSTLKITKANGEILEDNQWEFIKDEEKTKKDEAENEQIVRFGIKFAKAGTYYISYQTKAFKIPLPTNEEIINYLWIEGERYNGSSGIDDDDLLGVIKYHAGTDYMKRELTWWTSINKKKIVMKNAVIEDKYSRVDGGNKSALRLNEETLHIYPLKANPVNDNDIDKSRELTKGKDFTLEPKGENYQDGFIIKLIGTYASTSETLQIRYNTHFMMEEQSENVRGKSNYFLNSAIVTYMDDEGKYGYDSDEAEMWVDIQMSQNGWKYGAFVGKGEEYRNQVSPFKGEKPSEDSVYWTVPINSWGVKLRSGTIIKEDIHEGQTNPEVEIHKVKYGRPEYGLTEYGPKLNVGEDYELIPNVDGSTGFDIKLLKDINEPFALFIKVKADKDTFKYKNKVQMEFEDETLNLEAFVEKSDKGSWLTKSGGQEISEGEVALQANYEIVLNKDSRTINDPIITDTVKINEQTFQQEGEQVKVRAYKAIKQHGQYIKGDEVDLSKDGRSAKITTALEQGTQTLTISLGKTISEPYLIEYHTNIDPALKNGTQIINKATLFGAKQQISETTKTVEVKSTQGSGTSSGVDGALKIRKVDEDKRLIDGITEFAIFRVDQEGTLLEFLPSVKVKKDRIVQVGENPVDLEKIINLRYGTYAIQELKAPDEYELDDTVYRFTIDDNTPNHEHVHEQINHKIKLFELSILKQSMVGDRELKGGEFSLTEKEAEQVLATATTERNGIGKFVNANTSPYVLQLGKTYTVKETKAPDGFVKLKGEFTVSVSKLGEVSVKYDGDELKQDDISITKGEGEGNSQIQFTARNNPRTPLPKTGGAGLALFGTLGLIGLIIGLWYHFPMKKKEGLS